MKVTTGQFFEQNEWANLALLDACRPLTDEQLDAAAPGTYGSIRDTLLHFIRSEGWYASILGHPPQEAIGDDEEWPGFDRLAEVVRSCASAYAAASSASELPDTIRVGPESEPEDATADLILVQAFHHSTEHRSQVCTVLTTIGVEPPDLSSWAWGLATGRLELS